MNIIFGGDKLDNLFLEIVKYSPILGLMLIFWFYQRKDYRDFVSQVQAENSEREKNYQNVITELTKKFNIVETVKTAIENVEDDVKEIKIHIFKN